MNENRNWMDALTDGQIIRDWFSLFAHFALGSIYITFFITMFMVSIGLSFILVGIPLLLFVLTATRAVAAMDQRLFAGILDRPQPNIADDVDPRGANFGERLGMYLGSGTTWRSILYIALKFPIGLVAITAAFIILPFLAIEMLSLAPLGIDMRLATPRLLHAIAVGMHKFPGVLLPSGKRKRDLSRLETVESHEQYEPEYTLDDDGEIVLRKRA
ncbi:MAG: sensor domain-containing protein [Chloroflexi bacterium]|nr:sensor domain-containing protein [Chloroflexota bacterium]MCC6892231.1 sensor domain-containing protein [Anaerolineae bacterium]